MILPGHIWVTSKEDHPEERYFLDGDVHVGETSSLQKAIKESVCYSGRVEAARATLDQVTIEDIDTNVAVVKVHFCRF